MERGDGNNAHTRDADPGQPRDADPGGSLADALKLIGELPLTPTEKAEAVRKLLAEADG